LGTSNRDPFLYVENNEMKGLHAPYYNTRYYFLFQKFNVNFIDLGADEQNFCNDDGLCTGSMSFQQSGLINAGEIVTTDQIPNYPKNLTIGPVLTEDKCHLINFPNVEIAIRSKDFLDLDERFDFPAFILSRILSWIDLDPDLYQSFTS
jgi:hypothetical protein